MSIFIEGVPKVYLYGEDSIKAGDGLWRVGQGGVTTVSEPYYLGVAKTIEDGMVRFQYPEGFEGSRSLLDSHVIGDQTHNNWYLCSSEDDARSIYDFMVDAWNSDASYEEERAEFDLRSRWFL